MGLTVWLGSLTSRLQGLLCLSPLPAPMLEIWVWPLHLTYLIPTRSLVFAQQTLSWQSRVPRPSSPIQNSTTHEDKEVGIGGGPAGEPATCVLKDPLVSPREFKRYHRGCFIDVQVCKFQPCIVFHIETAPVWFFSQISSLSLLILSLETAMTFAIYLSESLLEKVHAD